MPDDSGLRPASHARRVELWRQFYQRENSRKLIGFFVGSEFPAFRYRAARGLPDDRPLRPEDFVVEDWLADYDRLNAEMESCPGDFMFSASAYWGLPWCEAALGCPVRVNHATGSLYAQRPPDFPGNGPAALFDPDSPWVRKMVEFLDRLAAHSGGRYPLGTTRMRGIADLLAVLYGGEEFVFRMMEEPEEVREVCERLTGFYIDLARMQLGHIPLFHGGTGSFYYHAWAPAGTVWHQEDSVMLLSPELYSRFILPCDRAIFAALPGNIMHFHSTGGYIPVEEILDLRPTAVEMHVDSGGPRPRELQGTHRKILDSAPLIIWGAMTIPEIEWLCSTLPDRGVAIHIAVESPEQAREIWAAIRPGT